MTEENPAASQGPPPSPTPSCAELRAPPTRRVYRDQWLAGRIDSRPVKPFEICRFAGHCGTISGTPNRFHCRISARRHCAGPEYAWQLRRLLEFVTDGSDGNPAAARFLKRASCRRAGVKGGCGLVEDGDLRSGSQAARAISIIWRCGKASAMVYRHQCYSGRSNGDWLAPSPVGAATAD